MRSRPQAICSLCEYEQRQWWLDSGRCLVQRLLMNVSTTRSSRVRLTSKIHQSRSLVGTCRKIMTPQESRRTTASRTTSSVQRHRWLRAARVRSIPRAARSPTLSGNSNSSQMRAPESIEQAHRALHVERAAQRLAAGARVGQRVAARAIPNTEVKAEAGSRMARTSSSGSLPNSCARDT